MGETYNAGLRIILDTRANIEAYTPLEAGRAAYATDTGALYLGDGSTATSSRIMGYFDIANKRFGNTDPAYIVDFTTSRAADDYIRIVHTGNYNTGVWVGNINGSYQLRALQTTGDCAISDISAGTNPIVIDNNSPSQVIYIAAAKRLDVGGAFAFGSGGVVTLTTGTYDGYDVTDTGLIYAVTTGGNVTINDFTNGVASQILHIMNTSGANDTVITDASGSNQQIYLYGGTMTFNNDIGMITVGCNGSYWCGNTP